jgi:tetratricopeptide (TPR) repeat protein
VSLRGWIGTPVIVSPYQLRALIAAFVWLAGMATTAVPQQRAKPRSVEELRRDAAADTNEPAAHLALGKALLAQRQYDEAEARLRYAVSLAPALAEAHLALGVVPDLRGEKYWKRRAEKESREVVAAAFAEGGRHTRLAFLLDPLVDPSVLPRAEERTTLTIDGLGVMVWWVYPLTKAINKFRERDYENAMKRCGDMLQDPRAGADGQYLPDDVFWVHALAAAHLDLYDIAATDFTVLMTRAMRQSRKEALDPNPLRANDHRFMVATMNFYAGRFSTAEKLYRQALEADLSLFMAHSRLAEIHEREGRWDEAIAERHRAVEGNPDHGNLLVELGMTLARAGRVREAAEAFEQAGITNPLDPHAFYHAGIAALDLGRTDEGRRWLERYLNLAPRRAASQVADVRARLASIPR